LTILIHNSSHPFIPFCSTKWEEIMSQDVKQLDCSSRSHNYNTRETSGWSECPVWIRWGLSGMSHTRVKRPSCCHRNSQRNLVTYFARMFWRGPSADLGHAVTTVWKNMMWPGGSGTWQKPSHCKKHVNSQK
jgi:hypothetical protein